MWYAIIAHDAPHSTKARMQARSRHLERIEHLNNQARLLVAGPCPTIDSPVPGDAGFSGSIIIAEFDALDQAEAWANADPYVEAGVYTTVQVRPFIKVLP